MYDIYLARGCQTLPPMNDLVDVIPKLQDAQLRSQLLREEPGFLDLEVAKKLMRYFKYSEARAIGSIIPVKYKTHRSRLGIEAAYKIAEKAMRDLQINKYPGLTFGPIKPAMAYSSFMYYTFLSRVKEWIEKGIVPDAIFVSIDVLDGHVWTDGEMEELAV